MSQSQLDRLACRVRELAGALVAKDTSDADLLERFTTAGDSAALAALVERHAGLVWSVCARVLPRPEDAEDAFQATFLVLLRKAGSVRKRGAVASWLYGVARRTAVHMRRSAARRARAAGLPAGREPELPVAAAALRELQVLLDQEVQRLPEMYRAPFVLCVLEGRSRAEAARELGWKEGTVAGRLARARELLQRRLARRGVALAAALCAGAVAGQAPAAAAPAALVASVTGSILRGTAGGATFHSATVVALAREVQRSIGTRVLLMAAVCLSAVLLAGGVAWLDNPAGEPISFATAAGASAEAPDPPTTTEDTTAALRDRYGDPLPAGVLSRLGTVRFRHGYNITSVAFAPDGKTIATAGLDHAVHLWDTVSGAERGTFRHPDNMQFLCLAFAPDGRTIAAGDTLGRIWLCDGANARQTLVFKAHDRDVQNVRFSADGAALASAGREGSVALWETATGVELRRMRREQGEVYALAFSPDGRVLASGGGDKKIHFWDPSTGKELASLDYKSGVVSALAFSPDAKVLASGAVDRAVSLWDVATRAEMRRISIQAAVASGVAFTPDGKRLAVASRTYGQVWREHRGAVDLFDVRTGESVRRFAGPRHPFEVVAFSPDGTKLAAVGGHDSTLHLWEVATGAEIRPAIGHQGPVWYVALAADSRTVATAAADDTVRLWDARTGKLRRQAEGCRAWFSPDGGTLLTLVNGERWTLRGSDVGTGRQRFGQLLPECDPYSMTISTDGRTLAFEGAGHAICLWDVASGEEQGQLAGHPQRIAALTFSPDGTRLASASPEEKLVCLWDVAGRREVRRFTASPGSLAFSPDGTLLAAGGEDEGVRMWDTVLGKEIYRLADDKTYWTRACNIGFSPDGRTLAAGSMNGQLLLWETATGRLRHRFDGFAGGFGVPTFSPDGRLLVAGRTDTTALVWDLRNGAGAETPLAPAVLTALWGDLASEDAGGAYQAVRRLTVAATQSVPFLREHLRPVAKVEPARVAELIANLDNDKFATREKATAELAQLGEAAVPALRKALAASPSPEVRRRAEPLLEKWTNLLPTSDRLQALRALEALEHAGTPDARRTLQAIADGEPSARLTREARDSRDRLDKRSPSGPIGGWHKQNGEAEGKTHD
jgi:RNA polymerase sigma factor (sigma-70 family)